MRYDYHHSYYAYDHGGERRLKLTGANTVLDVNADFMSTFTMLDKPTLYPSAYMVLSNSGYTKHYYAGAERVAARIGGGGLAAISQDVALSAKATDVFYQSLDHVTNRQLDENNMDCLSTGLHSHDELTRNLKEIPKQLRAGADVDYYLFRNMVLYLQLTVDDEPDVYFYHSDHLGSASWVTDAHGDAVQHLQYLPFGEPYIDQRTSGYNERFTFTGKERDEETGYGYFGARYMDHELMTTWLSVDPMADKYPSISPYAYCSWNPVRLVDPDGKETLETDIVNKKTGACMHIEDGKNQIVLLSDRAYNAIEKMGKDSYSSMNGSQQEEYNSLLSSGEIVSLDSKLGKTIRAVYAEMGGIGYSEQDRYIVAASIATRLKSEPDIDKVLTQKQYNAVGTDRYKIGPYEREKQIMQNAPHFYKAKSEAIMRSRVQTISASYKALNGLLPSEYNNIHSFVSPPRKSNHFDTNKRLTNITSLFHNLIGVSGVWRLK